MKILRRFFIFILVLGLIIVGSASIYFKYFGRDFAQIVLNNAFNKNVQISNISYQFPFGINISYVSFDKTLFSKKLIIQADPLSVFFKHIKLSSVLFVEPVVNIIKETGKKGYYLKQLPGDAPQTPNGKELITSGKTKSKKFDILAKKIIVSNGTFGFSNDGFSFELRNVRFQANNVSMPLDDSGISFNMSATLSEPRDFLANAGIKANGSINIFKKDLEAVLELTERNRGDIVTAKLFSINNDMKVEGHIEASRDIINNDKEKSQSSLASSLILDKLSLSSLGINAKFSFMTKMDDFKIEKVSFNGNLIAQE